MKKWNNLSIDCVQGRKNKKSTDMAIDWEVERENGVKTLLHLVSLNILRLWDPPIAEVEFVKQVFKSAKYSVTSVEYTRHNVLD